MLTQQVWHPFNHIRLLGWIFFQPERLHKQDPDILAQTTFYLGLNLIYVNLFIASIVASWRHEEDLVDRVLYLLVVMVVYRVIFWWRDSKPVFQQVSSQYPYVTLIFLWATFVGLDMLYYVIFADHYFETSETTWFLVLGWMAIVLGIGLGFAAAFTGGSAAWLVGYWGGYSYL